MPAIHRDFGYTNLPDFIYWDTSYIGGLYLSFLPIKWAKEMEDFFCNIIAQPHPEFGMDPRWATIYPYAVRTTPKDNLQADVTFQGVDMGEFVEALVFVT